jgi:hypothetical protein
MATNAEDTAVDDSTTTSEEDIRNLKYPEGEVENSEQEEDESSEGEEATESEEEVDEEASDSDQVADDESESSDQSEAFVKEFPNIKGDTPEEYLKNLEQSYKHSTSEAMRLKRELDSGKETTPPKPVVTKSDDGGGEELTPDQLWLRQQMDEQIATSFENFKKDYPQVDDPDEYDKFKQEVSVFSTAIMSGQNRMASPSELYQKAALSLGWEKQSAVSDKEKLGIAIKEGAASSKAVSSGAKPPAKSKVSDAQVATYKKANPSTTLTDSEIRKELEPYIT